MSQLGVLRLPRTINFGVLSRHTLTLAVTSYGDRALIIVDPFLATTTEFEDAVHRLRDAGVEVEIQSGIEPELPVETLHSAADSAKKFGPDVIIGWGGGSALDAAKLIALLAAHGGTLPEYYGENRVPGPVVPLIAVPTTAGTGSEATPVAVVADSNKALKVGVSSPHLIPSVAIVDPELTIGAPPKVTAYAGIDALVHAVESYTARSFDVNFAEVLPVSVGQNRLSDPLSLEAARLIGPSLETAVSQPGDIEARTAMARGSLLAGMAFGSTGVHLSHAIQYPLGALTHTPHGLGTGMMLPYVMEVCAPVVPDRLAKIGEALGVGADGAAAINRVAEMGERIGLPKKLSEIGVEAADLPRIAELTLESRRLTNIAPLPVDLALITRILEAAFEGDRTLLRT